MKKFLLASLLAFAGMQVVFADTIQGGVDATTTGSGRQTVTVYNDSGSDLTSGSVVVWDNDDTEFDRSGYPYITTTTSADSIWTAGVVVNPTCQAGNLCEIVTKGWAWTNITGSLTEDTLISTSTTAARAGDSTAGNNVCYLGRLAENYNRDSGVACGGTSFCQVPVYVTISCTP